MINDDMPAKRAPVSGKVSNGTLGGGAVGLLVAILTYFVPAWHSAIPNGLEPFIPVLTSAVGYYLTGFASKHQATTDEVIHAIQKGEVILSEVEKAVNPVLEAGSPVAGRRVRDMPQA